MNERIAVLEARVAALEARLMALEHRGPAFVPMPWQQTPIICGVASGGIPIARTTGYS